MIKVFFITVLGFFLIFSCGSDRADTEIKNGVLRIVFNNKSDYEIKKIYISKKLYDEGYDYENSNEVLKILQDEETFKDKESMIFCDYEDFIEAEENEYYITYVRQKGSTDHELYVTTDTPVSLSLESGIVTIDLLPFSYTYSLEMNYDKTCKIEKE